MLHLHITSKFPKEQEWQNQLKSWCVAHKVTEDASLTLPEIHENKKIVKGLDAIDQFLKEYKIFMDDWYDCRCDKWMDK